MKFNELKNKTIEQLKQQLQDLLREQFNLRMQKGIGEMPRPHLFEQVRRDIARVKTMIHQQETQS